MKRIKNILLFLKLRQNILFFVHGFLLGLIIAMVSSSLFVRYVNKYNNKIDYYATHYPATIEAFDVNQLSIDGNQNDFLKGTRTEELILKKGGDIFGMLTGIGLVGNDIKSIINLMKEVVDFRTFQEGQKFTMEYDFTVDLTEDTSQSLILYPMQYIAQENRMLRFLTFKDSKNNRITINRNQKNNNLSVMIKEPIYTKKVRLISGIITTNLFTDVLGYNIKMQTLYQILNEYAFVIDFQRDVRKNDKFIFLLEVTSDDEGDIKSEKIIYANLTLSNKKYIIYNFHDEFYDENGFSVKKGLLRSPVDGARISSGFSSSRKHPILGYSRAHLGIDFAVPLGTPIYAAGDGVVTFVGWKGGYGNFVAIKHNQEYTTRYAHLSRFSRLHVGQKVKQKQVIGYVGLTGLASGPHLHYEILRYNKHVNPKSVKTTSSKKLDKKLLDRFLEYKDYVAKTIQEYK